MSEDTAEAPCPKSQTATLIDLESTPKRPRLDPDPPRMDQDRPHLDPTSTPCRASRPRRQESVQDLPVTLHISGLNAIRHAVTLETVDDETGTSSEDITWSDSASAAW